MDEPMPLEELIALLQEVYDKTAQSPDQFRRRFEDIMGDRGVREPITKKQARVLKSFMTSCALYQPDREIRRKSWGTDGPAEFLRAIEYTLKKLS